MKQTKTRILLDSNRLFLKTIVEKLFKIPIKVQPSDYIVNYVSQDLFCPLHNSQRASLISIFGRRSGVMHHLTAFPGIPSNKT